MQQRRVNVSAGDPMGVDGAEAEQVREDRPSWEGHQEGGFLLQKLSREGKSR